MLSYSKKFVNSVDKSDMRQVILDFPKQFKVGFDAAKDIPKSKIQYPISNLIVCGMGGSALPGELLQLTINNQQLTINKKRLLNNNLIIHKDYDLPVSADKNSLIICISYSGNTEETISAYKEALKRKLKIISIASGGKLVELSKKYETPIVVIPKGIQPRSALGYQFAALIKILENLKLVKNVDKKILNAAKNFNPQKLEISGKNLAKKLLNKIPIIYTSQSYKALAYIWKIKFNENSKIPAFWNYFPELNHNEMVGYAGIKNQKSKIKNIFHILILKSRDEQPGILKRFKLTAELLMENGVPIDFIELEGKNIWEKIFNTLILSDWISYYLAMMMGIDPTPIEMVEEFKKKLK